MIGYGEKMETHVKEHLHRGFSLFGYNWENHMRKLDTWEWAASFLIWFSCF